MRWGIIRRGIAGGLGLLSAAGLGLLLAYKAAACPGPLLPYVQGSFLVTGLLVAAVLHLLPGRGAVVRAGLGAGALGVVLLALLDEALVRGGWVVPGPGVWPAVLNLLAAALAFGAALAVYEVCLGTSALRFAVTAATLVVLIGLCQRLEAGPGRVVFSLDNRLLLLPPLVAGAAWVLVRRRARTRGPAWRPFLKPIDALE